MASLIPGFEYDIFISYRQKDNKGDRWVSEFVEALKSELESTFKEEISVYFDINPHDGLLETHDVDASLKDKLKCLVFIPIISRTYCDPKSFAWEHEFKAFVEQASQDQFGLKVKLPNGNVGNRVLPVRIYDLDSPDIKLCESVLKGALRSVDFIYKFAGVNRPLRAYEDHPQDNLNKTYYRDQINKVANSIKEIITVIGQPEQKPEEISKGVFKTVFIPRKSNKWKIITGSIIILALIILGLFFIPKLLKPTEQLEKSIAVLPFRNDSRDSTTINFMDGVMEEILNRLQTIKDLAPISRSSVEQYRNTMKPLPEIARERHVNYIVEGSGQKYGDSIILRVQLIEIRKGRERHLMGKSFRQKLVSANTFFNIQSLVAQSIATELNATITPREKRLIEILPTGNLDAYEAYLKGQFYLNKVTPDALDSAMHYFEKAKDIDSCYALAYAGISDVWGYRQQTGMITPSEGNTKSMAALKKAVEMDSTSSVVQYSLAIKKTWGFFDWEGGESCFKKSISLNPNNVMAHAFYSHLLNIVGRPEEAMEHIERALKLDPMNPVIISLYGMDLITTRKYNDAIKAFQDALKIEPGFIVASTNLPWTYYFSGLFKKGYEQFKVFCSNDPELLQAIEQGYYEDGWRGLLISYNKVCEKRDNWSPSDIAGNYALLGVNDKAMYWLERAYADRDPNLPYLLMPQFDSLRSDPRFQDLCRRMKLPYK